MLIVWNLPEKKDHFIRLWYNVHEIYSNNHNNQRYKKKNSVQQNTATYSPPFSYLSWGCTDGYSILTRQISLSISMWCDCISHRHCTIINNQNIEPYSFIIQSKWNKSIHASYSAGLCSCKIIFKYMSDANLIRIYYAQLYSAIQYLSVGFKK